MVDNLTCSNQRAGLLRDDEPRSCSGCSRKGAEGLGLTLEDVQQQVDVAKQLPRFQPIVIKPEATPADIAFTRVASRGPCRCWKCSWRTDGANREAGFWHTPAVTWARASTDQIEASNGRYRPGDIVGKSGIERQYNEILMGTDGQRRVIVNSVGREMGCLSRPTPTAGKAIRLTIDEDLQAVAEQDLAGKKGAVVALDPKTGEILALASQPSFDPNDFAVRVSGPEWQRLNEDPERPLLNRAVQAQLAPGSVFKVFMTTAMLESKAVPEDYKVFCPGYADFYGRTFHDDEKGGHGEMDLHTALVKSCDVYFYNVGKQLGIDRISYYATKFGLGRKTGVDIPGEEPGLVPSEEWKERVFRQKWYPREIDLSFQVGQGATMVTPMQLAYTIGGIVMGGKFHQPHLLMSDQPAPEVDFPIAESTVDFVTQAMWGVVNEGGTAAASRLPGIEFCGKTGTAQVISLEGKQRSGKSSDLKNNAWFVGFAPRRNPDLVVAVLVQSAGYGATFSAPIARDIVKAYYDKKQGKTPSQLVTQASPPAATGSVPARAVVEQAANKAAMPVAETASAAPAR